MSAIKLLLCLYFIVQGWLPLVTSMKIATLTAQPKNHPIELMWIIWIFGWLPLEQLQNLPIEIMWILGWLSLVTSMKIAEIKAKLLLQLQNQPQQP